MIDDEEEPEWRRILRKQYEDRHATHFPVQLWLRDGVPNWGDVKPHGPRDPQYIRKDYVDALAVELHAAAILFHSVAQGHTGQWEECSLPPCVMRREALSRYEKILTNEPTDKG